MWLSSLFPYQVGRGPDKADLLAHTLFKSHFTTEKARDYTVMIRSVTSAITVHRESTKIN